MAASIVALTVAGTTSAGNTRSVTIGSATDGVLTSSTVSSGEQTSFVVTVKNTGNQTLNNISVVIGQDDNPAAEGAQSTIVPTIPVGLPAGVTAAATGCTGSSLLTCLVGQLGARASWSTTVIVSTTTDVAAALVPTKAVAYVAEIGNDNGSNQDTFAAEGAINVLGYSCDAVTAYRATGSKTVSTPCGLTTTNKQQSAVTLPGNLTTITLTEGASIVACPVVTGLSCIGDAVYADISGDAKTDVVTWTLTFDVTGLNINTAKLVVYHYDDVTGLLNPAAGISLAKKNACKSSTSTGCGSATLSGTTLTVVIQTAGNGKTRLLG